MTDEELKQRYGIHLATRLQSDDPGRQANWADIDDDDDDWAPETIEWTDGTKITLPQADETPVREPTPVPAAKPIEIAKPKSPAPIDATASPTIKPSGFSGRAGLVLKGAAEKPTLVAKPPGPPTPVKSPWAPLPPVDRAAPIPTELPNHQPQPPRFAQRDSHGFQGMPPPPAKEIAADDFSRSWRDGQNNTSRELYNAQSGRYEPANENRRGSRNDHSRQPAVLQRPQQQDGPAEPSAAFQTHRATGHDGSFSRRRTSSNVSAGSGHVFRRMSKGDMPPHELLNVRRGSLAAVSDEPSSPRNFSPSGQIPRAHQQQNAQWQARAPSSANHQSPQLVHGQPAQLVDNQPQVPYEDPVKAQEQIMRQTRELARIRRQEEEAREEAAKQERIRLKLEAMGPPPEKKKDRKDTPREEKVTPTQIQIRVAPEATVALKAELREAVDQKNSTTIENSTVAPIDLMVSTDQPINQDLRNGNRPNYNTASAPVSNQENRSFHQGATSAPPPDRFQTWAHPQAQQAGRGSVWGPPPSNDRTLGNGTFNPELSRLSDMPQGARPSPIGPPRGNGQYQQGRNQPQQNQYGSRPAPIGPPSRQPSGARDMSERVMAAGWGDLPDKLAKEDAERAEQAEAERRRKHELMEQGLLQEAAQPEIKDTWRKVKLQEDGTRGSINESITHTLDGSGTWKKDGASRPVVDERSSDAIQDRSVQPQFSKTWKTESIGPSSVRTSKFFPINHDVRAEDSYTYSRRPGSPSPPPPTMEGHPVYDGDVAHPHVSLPQPSPVVKLPPVLPTPIGPPRPTSFAAAVNTPAPPARHSPRTTHDIRNEAGPPVDKGVAWQARIDTLFDKKHNKSHTLAVDSSSKSALELPNLQFLATVSLPSSTSGDLASDENSIISKPPAELCFEEQEMGSLPAIKVPGTVPKNAWSPAPAPKVNKKYNHLNVLTVLPNQADEDESKQQAKNGIVVIIKLSNRMEAKSITLPIRQSSNGRNRGGHRGTRGSRHTSTHRGRGGRDASAGFSPSTPDTTFSPSRGGRGYTSNHDGTSGHSSRGGRGRGRGGNNGDFDWSRNAVPAPINA